jgi:ribonuclease HI
LNPGSYRRTPGRNKQFLLKKSKTPTNDRRREIEDFRFDNNTYRVYTDASELQQQGIFGLAFTSVGGGSVIVKSKKYYNQEFRGRNVYAEVMAIAFAIEEMINVLKEFIDLPEEVIIFCDLNWIEELEDTRWARHPRKKQFVENIQSATARFKDEYPDIKIIISYAGKGEKLYNPYYIASHNASRKIVGNG